VLIIVLGGHIFITSNIYSTFMESSTVNFQENVFTYFVPFA